MSAADHPTEQADRVREAITAELVRQGGFVTSSGAVYMGSGGVITPDGLASAALDAAPLQVPPGPCTEQLESAVGSVYFCDLLHGHTGMHMASDGSSWLRVGSVGERDQ